MPGVAIVGETWWAVNKARETLEVDWQTTHADSSAGYAREAARLAGGDGARFLLVAAQPLAEPVARGGPFVMNTREEVLQAFDDYRNKQF